MQYDDYDDVQANKRQQRKETWPPFRVLCSIAVAVVAAVIIFAAAYCILQSFHDAKSSDALQNESHFVTEANMMSTGVIEENLPPKESLPDTTADVPTEYDYSKPVPLGEAVSDDFFDDAVFIGDSRTEGFILNAGLSNTVSYTYKGLTVDTVFTKPVIHKNGALLSVMDALKVTDFTKVYIMLGVNETGWPYSSVFIEKYGQIIDTIKEINPKAIIYVQEIFPVSREVSATHSYVKNDKICEINYLLSEMAKEKQVYYIDVGTAVSAEDGSLPAEAAVDGIHLKREYCLKWLDYLKTHTVVP